MPRLLTASNSYAWVTNGPARTLIELPDDAQFTWHERVLLLKCQPGMWLCWTPEFRVEVVKLTEYRVIPLEPGGHYPDDTAYDVKMFADITDESLESAKRQAETMASILGFDQVVGAAAHGSWLISDTAHPCFGEAVPDAA